MSPSTIGLLAAAIFTQLVGIALLPRTSGFTSPVPTFFCCLFFLIGIGAMARLSHKGIELGILIPIMSCAIPLMTLVIGMGLYGENASPLKLSLLLTACALVAGAAALA